jgi:tRNA nucleotidyltransferase (CCA-adding enzyme)
MVMDIYLVGGAVRDALLGLPVIDRDWLVVGGTADELLAQGFQPVGQDFPVFLHPDTHEEYALARTERKSGHGYKGFSVSAMPTTTIEEDLMRRDLTVNAIAQAKNGDLIDPYQGVADLEKRCLRHISEAFSEDPLRVLRVARFAARFHHLGFTIAPETLALMTQMTQDGALSYLVAERVWQETYRGLSETSPWIYIDTLKHCGALKALMPAWDAALSLPLGHDPATTVKQHVALSLSHCDNAEQRFALLCYSTQLASLADNDQNAALQAIGELCQSLKVPNKAASLAMLCTQWIGRCHGLAGCPPEQILTLINQLGALKGDEPLQAFLACCRADFAAQTQQHLASYQQGVWLLACVARCRAVNSAPFVQQGLVGKAIGQHMDTARIMAITEEQQTWVAS